MKNKKIAKELVKLANQIMSSELITPQNIANQLKLHSLDIGKPDYPKVLKKTENYAIKLTESFDEVRKALEALPSGSNVNGLKAVEFEKGTYLIHTKEGLQKVKSTENKWLFFQPKGVGLFWSIDQNEVKKNYENIGKDGKWQILRPTKFVRAWFIKGKFKVQSTYGILENESSLGAYLLQSHEDSKNIWICSQKDFENYGTK